MALIKCAECRKEISTKATSCPGCGASISAAQIQSPIERNSLHRKLGWKEAVISLILAGGFLAWLISGSSNDGAQKLVISPAQTAKPAEVSPPASASDAIVQPKMPHPLLNASFSVAVAGVPPVLTIKTNLPDGTKIAYLAVTQVRTPCYDCMPPFMPKDLIVKNGKIVVTPYLGDDKHYMRPEAHHLSLFAVPKYQTPEIQSFLGPEGDYLEGPNVRLETTGASSTLVIDYQTDFMVSNQLAEPSPPQSSTGESISPVSDAKLKPGDVAADIDAKYQIIISGEISKYEQTKRDGAKERMCQQARSIAYGLAEARADISDVTINNNGLVLKEKYETNYNTWNQTQKKDCSAIGMLANDVIYERPHF